MAKKTVDKKILFKAGNWTDHDTVLLCEILLDPINRSLEYSYNIVSSSS